MRGVALLLATLLSASAIQAQGTAVVSGLVRDESGTPVREVLVVIDPDSLSLRTRTGADGRYRIVAPTGRFEVRVVRIGYKPQSHTIVVSGTAVELNIQLQSVAIPLATIAVRVSRPGLHGTVVTRGIELLPHEPRPLRGVNIEVLNEPYSVKSEGDGRFSIPQLPIGSHTVLVTLDRYATAMVPVTVPPEGGIELTFTLDSLYADYQFKEQDQMRLIGWRMRRAESPATFVSAHELDPEAKEMRDALRFSHSILTRGFNLMDTRLRPVIYIDGQVRPDLMLQDLKPDFIANIAGIEVYPGGSLNDPLSLPGGSSVNVGFLDGPIFSGGTRAPGSKSRTTVRSRGNTTMLVLIWTKKGR
jgi:hypothetical protein